MPDTPDFDKLPPIITWAASVGVFIGGIIAAVIGTIKSRNKPKENGDSAVDLQRHIDESELRKDLEKVLSANRKMFYDLIDQNRKDADKEMDAIKTEQHKMDIRIVRLEERRRPTSRS